MSGNLGDMSRLANWRKNHVSDRQLVLVLAFAIGLLASLAAYILHFIIKLIEEFSNLWFRCCNNQLALSHLSNRRYLADKSIC